jgi:hypothetical protein
MSDTEAHASQNGKACDAAPFHAPAVIAAYSEHGPDASLHFPRKFTRAARVDVRAAREWRRRVTRACCIEILETERVNDFETAGFGI